MDVGHKKVQYNSDMIYLPMLIKALWHKAWLILFAALLFGSAAYMGTKLLVTPTYQTSFTAYVNNTVDQNSTMVSSADITASRYLVTTYSTILVSRPILEEAAEEAGIDYSYSQLASMVTTSTVENTEIIKVSVVMENPRQAQAFASALADLSPVYIAKIVEGSSMQIIAEPKLPESVYSPDFIKNMALGFMLGAFLTAAIIIVLELNDDRIKSAEELERRFGIVVMGTIPDLEAVNKHRE